MDRRGFLRHTTVSAVGLSAIGAAVAACTSQPKSSLLFDRETLARPRISDVLIHSTVREIGAQYMAMTPQERAAEALVAGIVADAQKLQTWPWSPMPSLETLIASDFSNGHTVLPLGWVLAVTEARQCALFALSPV